MPVQLGVSPACCIEPCLALLPRTFQRCVEEFLHPPPTFLSHGRPIVADCQSYDNDAVVRRRVRKWEGAEPFRTLGFQKSGAPFSR